MSKRKNGTYTGSPMLLTRWPSEEMQALEVAATQAKLKSAQAYIRAVVLAKLKRDGFLTKGK